MPKMYKFPHKVLKYPLCIRFTNSTQNYENTQCVCHRCTYSLQSTKTLSHGRRVWTIEYNWVTEYSVTHLLIHPQFFVFLIIYLFSKATLTFKIAKAKHMGWLHNNFFKWRERVFISVEWISKYHCNDVKSLLMSF